MRLRDVHDIHLQSILNEQRGMSFSHVTKLRMVMQEMFHQAYRSRLIAFDPSDGLKLPKNVKRSHRSITEEERAHILEVAAYHPSGLWVLLILYTGLRPGEAAALILTEMRSMSTKPLKVEPIRLRRQRLPLGFVIFRCGRIFGSYSGKPEEILFLCSSLREKEPFVVPAVSGDYGIPSPKNWTYTWEQLRRMVRLFNTQSRLI